MTHWSQPTFKRAVDEIQATGELAMVCVAGISQVSKSVDLVRALVQLDQHSNKRTETDDDRRKLAEANRLSTIAQSEIRNGFPLLHAHSLVYMWSILEALIDDLFVGALMNSPALLLGPHFSKLKIPIAEYESAAAGSERMSIALRYFKQHMSGQQSKSGAARFEALLSAVALAGRVPKLVRESFHELENLRHVIVHRASVADSRLCMTCPKLGYSRGERVRVTNTQMRKYYEATQTYMLCLMKRAKPSSAIPKKRKSSGT